MELRRANLRNAFPDGCRAITGGTYYRPPPRAKIHPGGPDNGNVWLSANIAFVSGRLKQAKSSRPGRTTMWCATRQTRHFNDPRRFGQMDVFARDHEGKTRGPRGWDLSPYRRQRFGLWPKSGWKKVTRSKSRFWIKRWCGRREYLRQRSVVRAGINPKRPVGKINKRESDLWPIPSGGVERRRSGGGSLCLQD